MEERRYLNFTLDELSAHIERTPQGKVYADAYNIIGHGDLLLRVAPTLPLFGSLCSLIIEDVPWKKARDSVPFLAQFNPKIVDPDARGYLKGTVAPNGRGLTAFDHNKPYKKFKDKLILHSQNKERTSALFKELEQLTRYENSLDVFCMTYLLDMDVPRELKEVMHSDNPKKIRLGTLTFEEIFRYLNEHPEKNKPLKLSELTQRFLGNMYRRLEEFDHFYATTPHKLLSPRDPEQLETWRRHLFNLFDIDKGARED